MCVITSWILLAFFFNIPQGVTHVLKPITHVSEKAFDPVVLLLMTYGAVVFIAIVERYVRIGRYILKLISTFLLVLFLGFLRI